MRNASLLVAASVLLFPCFAAAKDDINIDIENTNINGSGPKAPASEGPEGTQAKGGDQDRNRDLAQAGTFKPWTIGVAGGGLQVTTGGPAQAPDTGGVEHKGLLTGGFARANFTDNWAIQGDLYGGDLSSGSLGHNAKVSGYAGHLLLGANFGYTGANAYLGAGGYKEKWSGLPGGNATHQGVSGIAGLEYKWDYYTISLEGSYRQAHSYGDTLAKQHNVTSSDVSAYRATAKFGFRFGN